MKLLLDSSWRAAVYLLMPRVIGLSLLPLLIAGGLAVGLGYFFWEAAVAGVRASLESWSLIEAMLKWVDASVGPSFRAVLAPLLVVGMAVPVVVVVSLLLVAGLMTPAIVSLVAERRFPALQRRHGAGWWQGLLRGLGATVVAMLALLITMPLWFIPPLMLLIPPLIWGWLTARVMGFDALADHASREEREALLAQHRWPMLVIGLFTGFLGAAPSLIWAISATMLFLAPLMVAVSVWLYTLVFAFSSLWFTHYALAALQAHRLRVEGEVLAPRTDREPAPQVIEPIASGSTDAAPPIGGTSITPLP
ncbi:MAG: hypothetical protein CFE46_19420 [Burkholderiales bacterium PBB6]|nr:MAG: hypothetical protein CFE46_19420 [Burkholderiales bacterium PBB6]